MQINWYFYYCFLKDSSNKSDEIERLSSSLSEMREKRTTESETLRAYEKKIDVLERLKDELNAKMSALGEHSSKSNEIYAKFRQSENKCIELMQQNSEMKSENQVLKTRNEQFNSEITELKSTLR